MRPLAVVLAVALAVAGSACSDDKVGSGQAAISIKEGSRVLVAEPGGELKLAEGRRTVDLGAEVKVLAGSASITLADGAELEVRDRSEVVIGTPVSLEADDLLVSSGQKPVRVEVAGTQFSVDGVARLARDLAVSVAAYRGSVSVNSAGRALVVPALREAAVASLGVVPTAPQPLDYDSGDPWDRRFLGQAIELGDQLEAKSIGFTEALGADAGRTLGFYRLLLPDLEGEAQFTEELLDGVARPGEALVGATIALQGRLGTFTDRWSSVFAFRNQGARWGLVALDQQVNDTTALVERLDAAISRQSFAFSARGTTPAPVETPPVVEAPPPVEETPPVTAPPRAPQTPPTTAPPSTPPVTEPPLLTVPPILTPPDPTAPRQGLLEPLVTVVTGTLDGLLNGR